MRSDIRGRFNTSPAWPQGGMVSRPMDDRRFEVQAFTGFPVSTLSTGRWNRGILYRANQPVLKSSKRSLYMYDPTNPSTWPLTIGQGL